MNVKYRLRLLFAILVSGFVVIHAPIAQGSYETLWTALNSGTSGSGASLGTGPMTDEDGDPLDFILDNPIDADGVQVTGTTTIRYNTNPYDPESEDEYYVFRIDIIGGSLTFTGATTTVRNNYSDAGAFYVEGGSLVFSGVNMYDNFSEGSGGAATVINASSSAGITINGDATLSTNTAEGEGGAFALYNDGSFLTVTGKTELTKNIAMGGGGAIYALGSAMNFGGILTATENKTAGDGGAFYLDGGAEMTVTGVATFTKNAAEYDFEIGDGNTATGGGAIYANMSEVTFRGEAVFGFKGTINTSLGNTAKSGGGAIYAEGDSAFVFESLATFGGNTASAGSGGAILINVGSATFQQGATFQANEAKLGDGGAIAASGATMTYNGTVVFQDNIATGGFSGGGAIFADLESVVTFAAGSTVTFSGNKALAGTEDVLPGGGAVHLNGVGTPADETVVFGWIMNGTTTFSTNTAAGNGGAVYLEGSAARFGTTTFSGNVSNFTSDADNTGGGGALFIGDGSVAQFDQKATFQNNTALTGSGGAVYLSLSGTVDVDNPISGLTFLGGLEMTGNRAGSGGAFYLDGSVVTFAGTSTISGNTATTGGGGAFYVTGESLLQFSEGSETTIASNTTATNGGAIFAGNDSTLNVRLGGNATVTIDSAGTGSANDVYLGAGATLNVITSSGSKLSIDSVFSGASRDDGDTYLNVTGAGTVELNGDASGFSGDILIEGGTLKLGLGGGTLGDLENTILTVTDGGRVVVAIEEGSVPGVDDLGRLQVAEVSLDATGKQILFNMENFITDDDAETTGYALISIFDSSGEDILNDMIAEGLVGSANSSMFFWDIRSQLDADDNEIWTLYVAVYFDPNDPLMPWTFNIDSGVEELPANKPLDNTNADYPANRSKELEVNGAGTLKLNAAENKVGSVKGGGNIEFNGTLTANGLELAETDVRTFTGSFSGSGTFVKQGSYNQWLTGLNENFTGKFDVQEGTLTGNTDSLRNEITVADGAVLVFDQETLGDILESPERTFEGTLKGSGTVRFSGVNGIGDDGLTDTVLIVNTDSSLFTGDAYVDRGWLRVDGDNGNLSGVSMINVLEDGGLGGNGIIGHTTVNEGGALQAYNGTLNVEGGLTMKSGSIIYAVIGGTDTIDVDGGITLGLGTRVEIAGMMTDYVQGQEFYFLFGDVDSSINSGNLSDYLVTLDTYEDAEGNFWTLEFSFDADGNIVARGVITNGPDPPDPVISGLNRNQTAVAAALAVILPLDTTSTEMKTFINKLNTYKTTDSDGNVLYDEKYLEATQQLAGTVRVDGLQLGLYSPYQTVFNRLRLGSDLYGGSSIIYNDGYGPISGLESHGAGAGPITYRGQLDPVNPHYDGCAPVCDIPCMMGENNFWADVTHVQTKTKGDGNSDGYGISRTGLLIGLDVQKRSDSRIGFLFGYFAPYLWQNGDRVEADDYHAGMYFNKNHRGLDLYGYFGYAHQEYRSRRFVDMSVIDANTYDLERYTGKTQGDSFNFSLELSKPRYYGNCYVLRPLIGLDYYYTNQKGYAETGPSGGLFGLKYDRAKYDQWFVRVGMNLKKETAISTTVLRLQYINQFGENAYPDAGAKFVYTGSPTMNITGVNLRRDYLNVGVGFNLFMNESRSRYVSMDYDFNTSRRTKSHGVSLILVERF